MSLIINTPYVCPAQHWVDAPGGKLVIKPERRPASYEVFDARNNTKRTEVLGLVNTIRARVEAWREAGWPGVTIVTRKLLEHWHDREARQLPFYFCQLEAIETLIWWVEGAEAFKQGIAIPGDGGTWERLCNKTRLRPLNRPRKSRSSSTVPSLKSNGPTRCVSKPW